MARKKDTWIQDPDAPATAEELRVINSRLKDRRPGLRERPDVTAMTDPGDNTAAMMPALKIWRLPKIDMHDVEQVRQRIDEYFQIVCDNDMKPSVAALAMAFHIDRVTLWRIANAVDGGRAYSDEVRNVIKEAYQMIAAMMEYYMLNGKINPASGIFLMKNLGQGYKDVSDLVIAPTTATETYNADDIASRYKLID